MTTPRVALVKSITDNIYVKSLFASAFVFPPFLYRTGNRQAGVAGNLDMRPQSIRTFELLAGWHTDSMRLEINGYYNLVDDFITFDNERFASTRSYEFDNRGKLRVAGLEGSFTLLAFEGRLRSSIAAAAAKPTSGTSEVFLVEGELGGGVQVPSVYWVADHCRATDN